jgi:hypothetical protein
MPRPNQPVTTSAVRPYVAERHLPAMVTAAGSSSRVRAHQISVPGPHGRENAFGP